ncbi:MAG: 2-oxo acid dehydrogenase subunit E2 [Chloroflexi bacterium]|jgi:pyruvate/2-oxoglutarate dehydrogenase complex dihydrolipoamide acyltransferase (E2) component|nr:2-oxo acid dehydrogenase subunit E2 [Chloroflexota bacterium]
MPVKITVPLLGEGVEEVTIVNWLKAEGDSVEEFEGLLVVETDKVTTEIPSPINGTVLKIVAPEVGQIMGVDTLLAWIGQSGESIPDDDSAPEVESQTQPAVAESAPGLAAIPEPRAASLPTGRNQALGFISPVVARIAAEHQLDLSQIKGSGRNGRITKKDVLAWVASDKPAEPKRVTESPENFIPHTLMRRRIAEHMVASKHTSPHVTTVMEVDLSRVVKHRKINLNGYAQDNVRLTFTAYFIAATVTALKAYPLVNSSWSEDGLVLHRQINIGMATDLGDEGLIVPVIHNAAELSLLGLARAVTDLATRAREKKLQPAEVQGGTFTITNHGVSGSLFAMPVINQPQCAILGVGKLQKRVVVLTDEFGDDTIAIRPMAYLTLTFDHRILDGASADHFLAKVVESLENY